MAIKEFNVDLDVKGRVLASTVPNSTGSIVTWNTTTNVFGLRTNAQIISDLNLSSNYITTNTTQTGLTGNKTSSGIWTVGQVRKAGQDDTQMLLAGGGHRPVSDFALASAIPNNYITTNSTQTGLSGDKTTSGVWNFISSDPTSINVIRTSANNSSIGYGVSNSVEVYTGLANSSTFAIGDGGGIGSLNTVSNRWMWVDNTGRIYSKNDGDSSQWKQAYDWGNFRDYGLGEGQATVGSWDFDVRESGFVSNNDHGIPGWSSGRAWGFKVAYTSTAYGVELAMRNGRAAFQTRENGTDSGWIEIVHDNNLNSKATSLGFIKSSALPTVNNGELTLSTGTGLSGSATFTANQSGSSSFSVAVASTHKLPTTAEWTAALANTITRLRGTASGTYTSGDLTLLAGANTTITQSGANITIASTNTNTTYSNMSLTELNAGTVTTARSISAKTLTDWGNGKFALKSHTHSANDINSGTLSIARIPTGTTSTTVALGSHTHSWSQITGKPTTFTPSAHTHNASDVNAGVLNIARIPDSFVTKDNISSSALATTVIDFDSTVNGASILYAGASSTNVPSVSGTAGGLLIRGNHSTVGEYQLYLARGENDALLYRNQSGVWNRAASQTWSDGRFALRTRTLTAGNGLTGGGTLAGNRTITLGTPGAITLSSTNSVTTTGHTHTFTPGGTTAQYIRGDGSLATYANTTYSAGTLALLNAGTNTTNRVWGAKPIADYVKQYAAANLGLQGVTDIGNWTSNAIDFVSGSNLMFTINDGVNVSSHPQAPPAVEVSAIQSLDAYGFLMVGSSDTSPDYSNKLPHKFGLLDNTAVWANSFTFGSDFGYRFGYLSGYLGHWMSIQLDTMTHDAERLENATYTTAGGGYYNQRLHFPPENNATLATREWVLEGDDTPTQPPGDPSIGLVWGAFYLNYRLRNNFSFDHAAKAIDAVDTKYTAGSGLTLAGTAFSLPISTSGSGTYVRSVVQNSSGITVTLGTPPNTNTTYSGSTSITLSGTSFRRAALTGDVTAAANSNATTIANNAVTHAKYQNIATQRILGRGATGTGNVQELTLGSNLSLSTAGVLSATNTNTTYSQATLAQLKAGSNTANRLINPKDFKEAVEDISTPKQLVITLTTNVYADSGKTIILNSTGARVIIGSAAQTPSGFEVYLVNNTSTNRSVMGATGLRYKINDGPYLSANTPIELKGNGVGTLIRIGSTDSVLALGDFTT